MAFVYDPPDGYRNTTVYPTKPASETEFRDSMMDLFDQVATEINSGNAFALSLGNMYRQALINGNMDIWQRTIIRTNPGSGAYVADRWLVSFFGAAGLPATINHIRLALTQPELPGSNFAYRVGVDGGGPSPSGDDTYGMFQRIENGTKFLCGAGKKVTVSFWARSNISGKRIGIYLAQRYGTGSNSPSPEDILKGTMFNLTADWQQFSFTFNTATLQGKTFGDNNDDYLQLGMFHMWGSNAGFNFFNSSVIEWFRAAGNIDISQVQVSAGENVLPFQPKTYGQEWIDCQRYFQKSFTEGAFSGTNTNTVEGMLGGRTYNSGSFVVDVRMLFQTGFRKRPSVTIWSPDGTANAWNIKNSSGTQSVNETVSTTQVGTNGFTTFSNRVWLMNDIYNFHYTADAEM